jgi:hypothetical protein
MNMCEGLQTVTVVPGQRLVVNLCDTEDFPRNINHQIWYYAQEMKCGSYHYLLCQLDCGLFAYFEGFDHDGDLQGKLWVALEPGQLILHCMSQRTYRLYEVNTAPAHSWTACDAATTERRMAWAMLGHARLGAGACGSALALCAETLACVGLEVWADQKQAMYAQRPEDLVLRCMAVVVHGLPEAYRWYEAITAPDAPRAQRTRWESEEPEPEAPWTSSLRAGGAWWEEEAAAPARAQLEWLCVNAPWQDPWEDDWDDSCPEAARLEDEAGSWEERVHEAHPRHHSDARRPSAARCRQAARADARQRAISAPGPRASRSARRWARLRRGGEARRPGPGSGHAP